MSTDFGSDNGGEVLPDAHGPTSGLELLSVVGADEDRTITAETVDNRGPATVIARIALVAVVIGLFVAFARGSPDGSGASDPAADGAAGAEESGDAETLANPEGVVTPGVATAEFRAWPDPPEDHDPHIAGRPGRQEPVAEGLAGRTVVYVDERGRPIVIDLSTGDQRELDIAGPRDRDTFLVEFGRIVTAGSDVDLPSSQGRAFLFTVERTTIPGTVSSRDRDIAPSLSGPTLCLDEGGCLGAALLNGTFGDDLNRVTSMDGAESASQAIAEVIGSNWWRSEGRWTFFSLDSFNHPESRLRVPTPMSSTVVWLIEQLPPEPLTG